MSLVPFLLVILPLLISLNVHHLWVVHSISIIPLVSSMYHFKQTFCLDGFQNSFPLVVNAGRVHQLYFSRLQWSAR